MKNTGHRDEMVIATKYTLGYMAHLPVQQSNFGGTGSKSLYVSAENSLKRLQTAYIDIVRFSTFCQSHRFSLFLLRKNKLILSKLFVHCWDYATSIPELMQSLNTLVQQRKVLYLGISDTPAWVVVKANCYAREHGLTPFSVYQGRYSAQERDLERDVLPMCKEEGMAVQMFGVMGGGTFILLVYALLRFC
jgi:aryl-alcohol dehydrogenase-like predicted oxidoreductase